MSSEALNRASRSAEHTASRTQGTKPTPPTMCMDQRYSTSAGATPKERKSARLSNSAPKRDVAFSSRASRPSSPSIAAASTMKEAAVPKRPSKAKRTATSPAQRPSMVRMFGTSRLNDSPSKRGRVRRRRRRRREKCWRRSPSIRRRAPA
jgi:hypothetical protein